MDKKQAKQKRARRRIYILVAMLALIAIAWLAHNGLRHPVPKLSGGIPNINASGIATVIPDASYVPVLANKITKFEGALNSLGYTESSIATFNLSQGYNRFEFPDIISSSVFLMSNKSSAENALSGILLSSANQSSSGPSYVPVNYRFKNASVAIYAGSTIAIFNTSAINSTASRLLNLPIYQYVSVFTYGNYTSTIVLNSFSPNSTFIPYAVSLSENLVNQMAQKG